MIDSAVTSEREVASDASRRWWIVCLAIIAVATLLRLALNFRHALAPGMDAAYYPMQTRWLIEQGRLAYDAPPLVFWMQAWIAQCLQSLGGWQLDDACRISARLVDSVVHSWIALPIMMLGFRWSGGRRDALVGCAAAAVLATMSPPVMQMASTFQKNSVGLVWMGLAMWAINDALARKASVGSWLGVAALILLSALTHIGAFGVTCVMVGGTIAGYIALNGTTARLRTIVVLVSGTVWIGSVMMLAIYLAAPVWSVRLLQLPARALSMIDFRLPAVSLLVALIAYAILVQMTRRIWSTRHDRPASDSAVGLGCVAGLAILLFPLLDGTWAMRFQLMTPVPGAILLAFGVSYALTSRSPRWKTNGLAVAAVLIALSAPFFMQGPVITFAAADELAELGKQIENPVETLVIAPHGFEFWAGMMMHTQARSGALPDLSRYDRVFVLVPLDRSDPRRERPATREAPRDPRRGPSRPDPRRPGRADGPQRPENVVNVPEDAELIHNGTYFKLFEVT